MQAHNNDDILSPDYSNPLQYFSSHSLTRTTPPIYADDPWTTSSNASFDFEQNNNISSYAIDRELVHSFMMDQDSDQQEVGFGSKLTANNVLCNVKALFHHLKREREGSTNFYIVGVDVPDAYNDIYSKSNPHNEKVELKSLQVLIHLAGLSLPAQQKVSFFSISFFQLSHLAEKRPHILGHEFDCHSRNKPSYTKRVLCLSCLHCLWTKEYG
jgi:hypothetical protein